MKSNAEHGIHVMESFEFESGQILKNVNVEYIISGFPKYDEDGNIINAIIYFPTLKGGHSILAKFHDIIYIIRKMNIFLLKLLHLELRIHVLHLQQD